MARVRKEQFDGRHVSLSLSWPMDVYLKLRWEIRELETRHMESFHAPLFIAINGAITAWQLGDWTAGSLDELSLWEHASNALHLPMRNLSDLHTIMRERPSLVACQQIATAGKHKTLQQPTYRPGFRAVDQFEFHAREPIHAGNTEIHTVRTIAVEFPPERDGGVTRQETHSMADILADALAWWEGTLVAIGLWEQQKLDFFLEKHAKG